MTTTKAQNDDNINTIESDPKLFSLSDYKAQFPKDIQNHLESQYLGLYNGISEQASMHFQRILQKMKTPPSITSCRINLITNDCEQFLDELNRVLANLTQDFKDLNGNSYRMRIFQANRHERFNDVVEISVCDNLKDASPLGNYCSPPEVFSKVDTFPNRTNHNDWPKRMKVVICDVFCGEAVLRGSNIFVKGIVCADKGINAGDRVAVYADVVSKMKNMQSNSISRGIVLDHYAGECIFLGMGIAKCSRSQMFNSESGVGVEMCNGLMVSDTSKWTMKAVPPLPPLNGALVGKMMLQNLPSILVAHALDPKPKEIIADFCAAPGGKTSHVASLVKNDATIVAMDKSRKKVIAMRTLFETNGATCIKPIVLDSTKCLLPLEGAGPCRGNSVEEILSSSVQSHHDGLLEVKGFYSECFDRIVLDPPCSALGLRPKLKIPLKNLKELEKHSAYAKRFIPNAVHLLKNGGTLTYSTCTINSSENEKMVRYILDEFPCMSFVPIDYDVGLPGLPFLGLNDVERGMVRRFDPTDTADTMGFFVAKFVKQLSIVKCQ